jgi:hypothetical protein
MADSWGRLRQERARLRFGTTPSFLARDPICIRMCQRSLLEFAGGPSSAPRHTYCFGIREQRHCDSRASWVPLLRASSAAPAVARCIPLSRRVRRPVRLLARRQPGYRSPRGIHLACLRRQIGSSQPFGSRVRPEQCETNAHPPVTAKQPRLHSGKHRRPETLAVFRWCALESCTERNGRRI